MKKITQSESSILKSCAKHQKNNIINAEPKLFLVSNGFSLQERTCDRSELKIAHEMTC